MTTGVDSFVGRATELATLTRLLRKHRLVTVVGPAGVGKTRLASEAAFRMRDDHHDGTWFVDLAEIRREDLVEAAIARTLGVQLGAQSLVEALAAKECLLVLDNCEHVIDSSAAAVTAVLRGCPRVKVLATSREGLRSTGEQMFALRAVDAQSAVRLFVDRACAVDVDFEPGVEVEQLCERLAGLPLAIELAARWIQVLGLTDILDRVDGRLDLPDSGYRSATARHRSLRTAIDWSHQLLTDDEQVVFRRLTVLSGPFTLRSAAAVCGTSADQVLPALSALVAKSLLVADHGQYRLLDVIRAFGMRQLDTAGEVDIVTERLAESFHELLAPHEFAFMAPGPVFAGLDRQWQNLVTVTEWAAARRDARHGLLAYALGSSWLARGDLHEARRTLERSPESGIALNQLSVVLSALGDYKTALEVSDRASRSEHPAVLAGALHGRGTALRYLGCHDEAKACLLRSLEVLRTIDEPLALATCLNNTAWAAQEWGENDMAAALLDEGLRVARHLDMPHKLAVMSHTAGSLALRRGDLELAAELFAESLLANPLNPHQIPYSLEGLAIVDATQGAHSMAIRLAACAQEIRRQFNHVNEPAWQETVDSAISCADECLPSSERRAAREAGKRISLDEAAKYALAREVTQPAGDRLLTDQEYTVIALISEGMTNRQIANRLGISASTIATHLGRVRHKLGVRPRAKLAAWFVANKAASTPD